MCGIVGYIGREHRAVDVLVDGVGGEARVSYLSRGGVFGLPSRYEPCGMAQMIAMRYGCVPVARETGGLADTVFDFDLGERPTGFLFPEASVGSCLFALRRALAVHARGDGGLDPLRLHGMRRDHGWRRSAGDYVQLYQRLVGAAPHRSPTR